AAIGHPIVGDGNYGGKGAFLTGTFSRKMHLHSRRLRIDHPDGGAIDISAEVPDHFAASLDALGFDTLLGQIGIDAQEKGPPPKSALKAQAKAHSKQIRKARRGERRGRTADSKPTDFVGKPKPKPKAKSGKPTTPKPVGKKPTAKKHPARPAKPS
ncbi:MAG: RluA family pseudouridine synthase, partial [Sphingopyxis sp.]